MLLHLDAALLPISWLKILPLVSLRDILYFGLPVVIGFLWIWCDANRRGQPGWLWALVTISLNWLALFAYIVVRAGVQQRPAALIGPPLPMPPTIGTDQLAAS